MNAIEKIYEKAKVNKQRICVPECTNEIMMRAACRVSKEQIADVIFIGRPSEIQAVADKEGLELTAIHIVDIEDEIYKEDLLDRYFATGKTILGRGSIAARMKQPIYMALVMEAAGDADCTIAGLDTTTGNVIMAASSIIGMAEGIATASMFFAAEFKNFDGKEDYFIAMSDGGVTVDPTPEQLAGIAIATCGTYQALKGGDARCALLSFSTLGSGKGPSVDKVVKAKEIANDLRPDLKIDGEFQVDAALRERVAKKKVQRPSDVAGQANVLIFPNIEAANIGTKFIQMVSDCRVYGPILQGFRLPVCDCSRSDTEDILFNNMASTCVLASYGKAKNN